MPSKPCVIHLYLATLFLGILILLAIYASWVHIPLVRPNKPIDWSQYHEIPENQRQENWWHYFTGTTHVVYRNYTLDTVYISYDDGIEFREVPEIKAGQASLLVPHPFDAQSAFVIGPLRSHWLTRDAGRSWRKFELPGYYFYGTADENGVMYHGKFSFHADPEYSGSILISMSSCYGWIGAAQCHAIFYTTDYFQSVSLLRENVSQCLFAHSSKNFKPAVSKERVLCIAHFAWSDFDSREVVGSDIYFQNANISENCHSTLDTTAPAPGALSITISGSHILILIQPPVSSSASLETRQFLISNDTVHWNAAELRPEIEWQTGWIYSEIMESGTGHSTFTISIPASHGSSLYMLDTHDQRFLQTLNHIHSRINWIGPVQGPDGIDMIGFTRVSANSDFPYRDLMSVVTFDGGWTWTNFSVPEHYCEYSRKEPCRLHLEDYGLSYRSTQSGSSSGLPGQIIARGCVGQGCNYFKGPTWLTLDGGRSWRMISKHSMNTAFGGGGAVIIMIENGFKADRILVSLDYGETFREHPLDIPSGAGFFPLHFIAPNSETLKFLLWGSIFIKDHSYAALLSIDLSHLEVSKQALEGGDTA